MTVPRGAIAAGRMSADGVRLLQVFAVAVMVFPSDSVIKPIGAAGYPASLVGVYILLAYAVSVLFGFHDVGRHKQPMRAVLAVLWLSVLSSYVLMERAAMDATQLASADRLLIRVAVISGVALVAAERLHSLSDLRRVVTVLSWGGAFCGFAATLQYWLSLDIAQYLREIPGFTLNHYNAAIQARGSLNRVAGTATNPIELGVVAGMLLPTAVYVGMYSREERASKRWAPAALIGVGVATAVSRSAIISLLVAFAVLIVLMPPLPRVGALCAMPFALAGAFMSAHGLIGTLTSFFAAGSSDPSVQYRTHDYPVATRLWEQAPWFGHGGGTYLPTDTLNIFDNQYLLTLVELGAVGVLAFLAFLVLPSVTAIVVRRRSRDPELRLLCAALAAAGLAATVCSFTFDSLSFPMFVNVFAIDVGLIGACWRLVNAEASDADEPLRRVPHLPAPLDLGSPAPHWSRRTAS